jgi:hypothetical protein
MVVVPALTPQNMPVGFIVPTAVLLLTQVPPAGVAVMVAQEPTQTDDAPLIADGKLLTVAIAVVVQPEPNE